MQDPAKDFGNVFSGALGKASQTLTAGLGWESLGFEVDEAWKEKAMDTLPIWGPILTLAVMLLGFAPFLKLGSILRAPSISSIGLRRAWLALSSAVTIRQLCIWITSIGFIRRLLIALGFRSWLPTTTTGSSDEGGNRGRGVTASSAAPATAARQCYQDQFGRAFDLPTQFASGFADAVDRADFREFQARVGGMPASLPVLEEGGKWQEMMNKSLPGMTYRAWRHIMPYGGTEYLSRTVFEGTTVEEVCDFFNHDDVRASWDKFLTKFRVVDSDEINGTGAEVVFWERSLPVISNRDYCFTRRTWRVEEDSSATAAVPTTYYAINKGCHHPEVPEYAHVKRVDPYSSCWRIRSVPGPDGTPSGAVETILMHFEEQKVQHDVARLAVKMGMWGIVKNMNVGFRRFQREQQRSREAGEGEHAGAPGLDTPRAAAAGGSGGRGGDAGAGRKRGPAGVLAAGGIRVDLGVGQLVAGGVMSALAGAVIAREVERRHGSDHLRRRRRPAKANPSPGGIDF